ncbi:hypothetical protein FE257_000674 [Aspergillus nanangensis]|uniref:Uncharacterized protein n=1 Tax=Aspergillus nanangensis TaxID=2582783 RepID=A0AAD4GR78_ASPNN|nr:hypothetical protein FE257_000674 [Aspergillus nanangensis]
MSLQNIRNFSSSAGRKLLNLVGKVTLEDVRSQYNTAAGYEIQGAKAHKSSKDPSDLDDVLTIAFYSQNGTRLLSGHVHENGTYKLAESRAGKGKGGK